MFIRNCWYVAAWSSELSQTPISRRILGESIVLFRTHSGQAVALEDRCCHRGMPLSKGDVDGDVIRCPYHGLEFGPSGQCTLIPGQDLVPQHARVRSFPTVVQDEIVWIWPGDADKADPRKIVAYPYHGPDSGWAWKATVWHVKCHWELINDNLLDLTHLALVHKSMIGGNNTVHFDTQTQVARTEGGLRTVRLMPNSDPPPAYLKAVGFKGKVDRWQEMDGWPGLMLAYTGGVDAGKGALEGQREGGYQIRVFNGITPETETTTHYFWSKAHNFAIDDSSVTQKQFEQTETIFGEDRDVLELQQARILENPQRGFVDIKADHAGLLMRRIIRQALDMDTATTAKCPFSDNLPFPFKRDRGHPLDPPPEFGIFRRERPVSQVTLWDGSKVWLVTRYNDAQQVLGDVRFSSVPSQPGYPLISPAVVAAKRGDPSFLRMDPPTHTEHRRMWTPFFANKRIQELRPKIQHIIDQAIDEMLAATAPTDLVQDFALVVPSLVICELLDVPYSAHEFFQRHSKTIFAINATGEQVAEARAAIGEFWQQMIDAREKNPGDDLVSQVIVNEVGGGRLSKRELVAMVSLMLAAGHETTANMIALGVVTLLQHPEQLNAIKADPALTPAAVEELLRYLAVAQNGLGRAATEDIEVGGQLIRKGEGVLVLLAAANRDETVFENPDAFDIRRQPHRHASFGAAVHQCIGSPLARAELQMAFDTLFKRVPNLQLAVAPEDIKYKFDSLFFGVHSLPVSW